MIKIKKDLRIQRSFSQRISVSIFLSIIIILFFTIYFIQMDSTYFDNMPIIIPIIGLWIFIGFGILIMFYSGKKLYNKNINKELMTKKERWIIFFLSESIIIFSFLSIFLLYLFDTIFVNPISLTYGGFLLVIIMLIIIVKNNEILMKKDQKNIIK